MKKFMNDFKEFAMKGNVMDMAIGVIIGGAFGKIITSLVADIITPLLSLLLGKVMLTDLKWVIQPAVFDVSGKVVQAETALAYGSFLQSIIDFLIIALSIFITIRLLMKAKEKLQQEKEIAVTEDAKQESEAEILSEIRDLLKERKE